MTFTALLTDRAVFAVSGPDARDFLQGLITKDMRNLKEGQAVFAVLLSPQGRFLFDFFILEQDGRFLFDTSKAKLPDLLKRLSMYKLRAKVELTPLPDWQVSVSWGKDATGMYADPRLPQLGWRSMGKELSAQGNADDYELYRLMLAVPDGAKDLIYDRSILLEYGYDELNAVDFDKGCYVGQEVTARSKHRATLRKFIHAVQAEGALPPMGTPVLAGDRDAGTIAGSLGGTGLAHLKVEEVARAASQNVALTAAGLPLAAILPVWCRTAFNENVV